MRARSVVGNFAEVGGGGVEVRHIDLRAVGGIERIHPELEVDTLVNPEFALDVGVQPVQSVGRARCPRAAGRRAPGTPPAAAFDVVHETVGVEPVIQGSRSGIDVVWVAVVEDVAPIEQRSGLPFIGRRHLPPAENDVPDPAARQPLGLAERQLPDSRDGESVRHAVVGLAPRGGGVEFVIEEVAIALAQPGKGAVDREPVWSCAAGRRLP